MRRAHVTLMPAGGMPPAGPPPGYGAARARRGHEQPRNTLTDTSGRFEFAGLPAGHYRLVVTAGLHNGQYLASSFGSRNWADSGRVIELVDGQAFEADLPLRRGGAIAGRIVDEMGDPLSRVSVHVSKRVTGTNSFRRAGGGMTQSDDQGRYRVYGLEPGEYVVLAEARVMGAPPIEGVEPEGFVDTFHPAGTQEQQAAPVPVRAGADTDGIDIQLLRSRTYRITGTVTDSQGRLLVHPNAQLARKSGDGFSSSGVSFDAEGRFAIHNLVPGEYTFIVRPSFDGPMRASDAPPGGEYAAVPLSVAADIENLVVVTQPGATVKGRVVFTDAPGTVASALRVTTRPGPRSMMFGPSPTTTVGEVGDDGQFTLGSLIGSSLVRISGLRSDWALRAVMLGNDDITDTPVEFRNEHSGHLQLLVTTRAAAIEGTITDDDGKPVQQATVLVFPEHKEHWRLGSPRIRSAPVLKGGKYSVAGLVGGRYFAAALRTRPMFGPDDMPAEFFESLTKEATRFVVADDERRVVDLRVTNQPQ